MTEIILMDANEARETTERIRRNLTEARRLLLEMYEREGWRALGYESWREYGQAEFGYSESRIYQLMGAAEVERNISTVVENDKPIPERWLRPLKDLEPDQQRAVRQAVTARTDQVTGAEVERVRDELYPPEPAITVSTIGENDEPPAESAGHISTIVENDEPVAETPAPISTTVENDAPDPPRVTVYQVAPPRTDHRVLSVRGRIREAIRGTPIERQRDAERILTSYARRHSADEFNVVLGLVASDAFETAQKAIVAAVRHSAGRISRRPSASSPMQTRGQI